MNQTKFGTRIYVFQTWVPTIAYNLLKFNHHDNIFSAKSFKFDLKQRDHKILGPYYYTMIAYYSMYKLINDTEMYHDNDLRVSRFN